MHPAPPEDLRGLVDAFVQTGQSILDLGRTCRPADFALPTECPGWTVHDQFSHVVGVEAALEGRRDPDVKVPDYPHVTNDQARYLERAVELRRGRSDADVLSELDHVLNQRFSALQSPGLTEDSIIPGPFGPDRALTVARVRTFDLWTHEQDIRAALNRPGNLDSPAAAVVVDTVIQRLPMLVAKHAGLQPGQPVIIDVTGPVHARAGVWVEADERGRARGYPMFTGEPEHGGGEEGPTTSISLSTDAFTRRATGRRLVADTPYRVVGDDDVARRVLEGLVVTR